MSQLYLAAPTDKTDFGRFVVYPYDFKCSIWVAEGKAVAIEGGYRLLLKIAHCASEYNSKEVDGKKIKFETHPYCFFDIHSKEWVNKGFNGKPDQTIQPTDIELYLCDLFEDDETIRNGFEGEIHLGDYASLIELASNGSIDMSVVSAKMAKLKPINLSEEFKGKKEPPIYGAKGAKGAYVAKSEGDKAKERLDWIVRFCDPATPDGIISEGVSNALDILYGATPPSDCFERFIKLILP